MKIAEKHHGDVVVLSVKGNLTTEPETKRFRSAINDLVEKNIRKVVVDIGLVEHIGSIGLGAIMAAMISLQKKEGELCVANPTEKTGPLFRITKLVRVLKLYETTERAVSSMRQKKGARYKSSKGTE